MLKHFLGVTGDCLQVFGDAPEMTRLKELVNKAGVSDSEHSEEDSSADEDSSSDEDDE